MATELNIDDDSEDLWEMSNSVFDNYNEENVLKHLNEQDHLRTDRHVGFDNNSGDTWIYPTNYPLRKYQHDIVYNALFKNTLVCLPTGLGKTFIAAVVMYNFYRWYPQGKLIFMAPTKPLVAQQIEACYQVMGIPKEDTAEITGQQKKENRLKQWQMKRVFYATPQSVASDIDDPNFPVHSIKLVVIDEAHKAKGKYAYCEVIRIIREKNEMFRVLALSATPGRSTNDVAEVVHSLWISHIEVRTEKSADVAPYVHRKQIETIVIRLTDKIQKYHEEMIAIIDPYVQNLIDLDVISGTTNTLHRGWLLFQKQKYHESRLVQEHPHHSAVTTDFAACITLYHALELLERHGVWPFINYFDSAEENFIVAKDFRLKQFLISVRDDMGSYPFANGVSDVVLPPNFDFGHPKYDELLKCLAKHIKGDRQSQAIVFCEFRDSAFLIHQMLLQKGADIKPAIFIGQGSSTGQKGITQKQQIATMADFRKGTYNVLIATCVAEEGIDCGEVDLIVCFDVASKNPTRLVQRMGRTGRKRNGKVCLLVTEGKEQSNLKDSMAAKEYTTKKLVTHSDVVNSLCQSPRLVPPEFDPKCVETFIQTVTEHATKEMEKREDDVRITKDKRSTAPPPSTSTDLRNFFRPVSNAPKVHQTHRRNSTKQSLQPSATESKANMDDGLRVPTFWEALEDDRTSSALKAYAIKCNVSAWKDKFSAKTLPAIYESTILKTINDSACISNLMNGRQNNKRKMLSIAEFDSRNEPHDPSYTAKLVDRFIRARKMQKFNDISDVSSTNGSISPAIVTSKLDLSIGLSEVFTPFFDEIESKYEEVQPESVERKIFNSPVPTTRILPLKSSTPLTSKKSNNKSIRSNRSIKESPLARAFEKCKSLNESKKNEKRNRTPSTMSEALAFLGLSDVMDIFVDSEEKPNLGLDLILVEGITKVPAKLDKPSELNESIPNSCVEIPSTSVRTQVSTQGYTVSQILKIVNESNGERSANVNSTVKDKSFGKEIDIGTIDEIFGSSDSSDTDKMLPSGKQSASDEEDEDVIASSQPVIPEIKLPSKCLSYTENKMKSNHPERPPTGDDMFASFSSIPSSPSNRAAPNKTNSKHSPSIRSNLPPLHSDDINHFKSPSPKSSTVKMVERSPSLFSRKINLSRLKALSLKSNSERIPTNNLVNKSPLFLSQRNNDRKSTSVAALSDNESQIDETFRIHRNPNKRNRVINDTVIDESPPKIRNATNLKAAKFNKPKKLRKCNFIDDECDVSGGSSDDEHDGSLDADLNSIICNEEEHDDTSVDMRAIYLQSVISPVRKNSYRMSNPNAYPHNANIFSQPVIEEDESDYDTSFVVDECSDDEENEQEMSVLERAEWLLKMKRREKRKNCNNNSRTSVPKRRKIIAFNDSSDENS